MNIITRRELKQMLDRRIPRSWSGQDWRKNADGRIVRYVDWLRRPSGK